MSGITTGVGIFSGIDTSSLISQLLAIESRPKILAQQRIVQLQAQQAAFLDINSALSGLKTAADKFVTGKVFETNQATSSNSEALGASAGRTAAPGSYTFMIDRLVTTQQSLSRGFADKDASGLGAESITFEVGGGGVTSETRLSELNGGLGVARGKIEITDRSGAAATIDLSRAVNVDDVIEAINASGVIQVEASVTGEGLVLEDRSGGTGNLIVQDALGSTTATELGIAQSVAGSTLTGSAVRYVSGATSLGLLNDGNGVHIVDGSTDLAITARDGTTLQVDLGRKTEQQEVDGETKTVVTQARAATLQDVIDIINAQASDAGLAITAGINGAGTGLVINDATGGGGNLKIVSASGRRTAEDLGIAADVASSQIVGSRVLSGINSVLLKSLNGGSGLSGADLTFTDRAGASHSLTLSAAAQAGSLSDVVSEINAALTSNGVAMTVGLNRAGNGLSVSDTSGGSGNLVIGGTGATALGIETAGQASNTLNGVNLQKKWISRATKLEDLNVGQGIGTGTIRITDASGGVTTAQVGSTIATVGELISFLNSRPGVRIQADINDNGDGIVIRDTSGGSGALKIEDETGSVAKALNLRGEYEDEGSGIFADGSYERRIDFDPTDTLDDIVSAINAENIGARATIINDGSGASPYRLSITSQFSGRAGRVLIDTGDLDLGLSSLSKGEDAVAFFGSTDPAKAVLLTSSTNTLDNVVTGVTLDLRGRSEEPIEVVVTRNTSAIEEAIQGFVDSYNSVVETIDKHTFFDPDTKARGSLLGDSTASNVRSSLRRTAAGNPLGVDGAYQFLFQVGVRIGSGAKLEFDSERFRSALEDDFDNVKNLFSASVRQPSTRIEVAPGATVQSTEVTYDTLGFGGQFKGLVDSLINSVDGLLTQRDRTLDTKIELQEKRVEQMDDQLARKRTSLERQFIAMEQALASLQSQQSALQSLRSLG